MDKSAVVSFLFGLFLAVRYNVEIGGYDLATAFSETFKSVLNMIEIKGNCERIYLPPVSAALLPPVAPWYVEIQYQFAAQWLRLY